MNTKVVTRFAPSPTGHMHVGSYRTAFFSYLFAKKHGGKFILRIEDTDKDRSKAEYTDEILRVFEKIGISYDEKYIQSEQIGRHKELLQKLIDEKKAYISREEAKDGSGTIKDVIRFHNPNKVVVFEDIIRGSISTDTTDLGDFVIAKNINEPLFHFVVVVDDYDEGITHIIRAEEHIANTPRQILIYEALGFTIPQYAHLPLVLAPDKTKMSKRKRAIPVVDYLEMGYLPGALLNTICMCGWNPGTDQEIFSKEELENIFDLDKIQKSGAVFNEEKLNWFNREYLKMLKTEEFWELAYNYLPKNKDYLNNSDNTKNILNKIENIIRNKIDKFSDINFLFEKGEFDYFFEKPNVDISILSNKDQNIDDARNNIKEIIKLLNNNNVWDYESIKSSLWEFAEEKGKGNVLWPMRVALSGKDKSPDPFEIAFILGKSESIERLNNIL